MVEYPATEWPPPRTAMVSPLERAKPIAWATSAALVARAMTAGRRSNMALNAMRAAS